MIKLLDSCQSGGLKKWLLSVLISISLIMNEVKYPTIYLRGISISFSVFLSTFPLGFSPFCDGFRSSLCIYECSHACI